MNECVTIWIFTVLKLQIFFAWFQATRTKKVYISNIRISWLFKFKILAKSYHSACPVYGFTLWKNLRFWYIYIANYSLKIKSWPTIQYTTTMYFSYHCRLSANFEANIMRKYCQIRTLCTSSICTYLQYRTYMRANDR